MNNYGRDFRWSRLRADASAIQISNWASDRFVREVRQYVNDRVFNALKTSSATQLVPAVALGIRNRMSRRTTFRSQVGRSIQWWRHNAG